jgi:uncharacterized membrane protein (UPF0136 family)
MRHALQAGFSLALLVGLPVVLETPTSDEGLIAATIGALVLLGVAIHGVIGYVRSRKPRSYHDSVMPPVEPPK